MDVDDIMEVQQIKSLLNGHEHLLELFNEILKIVNNKILSVESSSSDDSDDSDDSDFSDVLSDFLDYIQPP